jgi:hypothetical protein
MRAARQTFLFAPRSLGSANCEPGRAMIPSNVLSASARIGRCFHFFIRDIADEQILFFLLLHIGIVHDNSPF